MRMMTIRLPEAMEESLKRVAHKRKMGKATLVRKILKANLPRVDPVLKRRTKKKPKGLIESIFGTGEWF